MFRRSVLIVAFVMSLPMLWGATVDGSVSWEAVGVRYLIALPVAAVLVALVRWAANSGHGADDTAGASEQQANR